MAILAFSNIIKAQNNDRSSVLMLVVDDWNDMVGAFGNNQAITPNIDKLCNIDVILQKRRLQEAIPKFNL